MIFDSESLTALAAYYRACLEQEVTRAQAVPMKHLHERMVLASIDPEALFGGEPQPVSWTLEQRDRPPVNRWRNAVAGPTILAGFPLFRNAADELVPALLRRVTLSGSGESCEADCAGSPILVNEAWLDDAALDVEEKQALRDFVGFPGWDVRERLARVFGVLELPGTLPPSLRAGGSGAGTTEAAGARMVWLPQIMLFEQDFGPFTAKLRRELGAFERYKSVRDGIRGTALELLLSEAPFALAEPGPDQPPDALAEARGLNETQRLAVERGRTRPLTVVTGPPGTGKSRVVVNLLASAIRSGKPVLFASKNNKAVDVVCERLHEIFHPHDYVLRLGSRQRMGEAESMLLSRLQSIEPEPAPRGEDRLADARRALADCEKALASDRAWQQLHERTQALARELPEPLEQGRPADLTAAELEDLIARLEALATAGRKPRSLWRRLSSRLLRRRSLERGRAELQAALRSLGYLAGPLLDQLEGLTHPSELIEPAGQTLRRLTLERRRRLRTEALAMLASASSSSLRERLTRQAERTAALELTLAEDLKRAWRERLIEDPEALRAAKRYFELAGTTRRGRGGAFVDFLRSFESAVDALGRRCPVWIVTNLSVANALPLVPQLFDCVVIDEASQCDVASALPLLYRAKRAVIIGDPHQLQNVVGLSQEEDKTLRERHGLAELPTELRHFDGSLYAAAEAALRFRGEDPVFLEEHYRSHASIAEFVNREIYGERLRVRTDPGRLCADPLSGRGGLRWRHVAGRARPMGKSHVNDQESEAVCELILGWLAAPELAGRRVGVVTPFRGQQQRIWSHLKRRAGGLGLDRLRVGTVHTFQGDECDLLVLSPVVAEGMRPGTRSWVGQSRNLINVAVTRARAVLVVVGDRSACEGAGGILQALVQHAESLRPKPDDEDERARSLQSALEDLGFYVRRDVAIGKHRIAMPARSLLGTLYSMEWSDEPDDPSRRQELERHGVLTWRIDPQRWAEDRAAVTSELGRLP